MWNFVVNYSPIIHCIAVLLEHLAFYSCTMLLTANAPLHFTQKVGTSSLAYGGIRLQSFKLYFRQKVHNYSSLSLRSWQLESQPIRKSALASIMMEEKKMPDICGCITRDAPFNPSWFVAQRSGPFVSTAARRASNLPFSTTLSTGHLHAAFPKRCLHAMFTYHCKSALFHCSMQ